MTKIEIEQLKASYPIENVIGETVKLERKGTNYVGLCPFHEDHHPSLVVNPQKQTFKCFACGEHGDVIEFIEKTEHCNFMEAVGKLKIENRELKINKKNANPVDRDNDAKQFSIKKNLQFFSTLLPYACGYTELTPAYLDFEVGQSPVNVPKEWYAMRNRVIFPIRNEAGELIAFAARRLTDNNSEEPKYINTSTANGYKKSENLYALHRAKEAIAGKGFVFVVEGYKDAIAMHAAGFSNTVALCGTALTTGQIALLKKYTSRICLLLDGDKPGREAARKISLSLNPYSMEVQTIFLPEGEDPDSLFRRLGREEFARMIGRLQNRPHSSECALLTVCLLYPEVTFRLRGAEYLFIDLVASALETDDLWFEDADHQRIFEHLQEAGTENGLSAPLQCVVAELHREYDTQLQADLELLSSDVYLPYLLFLYSEARLLRLISRLVRQVVQEDHEELQYELVIKLAERREQLRHVSVWLDRPGAV